MSRKRITCLLGGAMILAFAGAARTAAAQGYDRTDLVSNLPGRALKTDPNLVNPWGVAFFPGGAFWINDNHAGLSTLYDGQGNVIPAVFTIPAPPGVTSPSSPTGEIINYSFGFLVPGTTLPANFIFSTEDGTISAWAGGLPTNPTTAVLAVDNSAAGAVYKGLEFGTTAAGNFIYATNFFAGTIDVFDSNFKPANAKLLGTFQDVLIPPGYAPFGIRNIAGNLYVTYAVQKPDKHDDMAGLGHGIIDVFDTDGRLVKRFAQHGLLDSPWGIAQAPQGFGTLSNDILIGNFGNGAINAFDLRGHFVAQVKDAQGSPMRIPGLWGLYFGGAAASTPQTLYFTAGPDEETNGLFGSIAPH